MKVLVIAPHMDDEVLGCGGAIVKHKKKGVAVHVLFIANRVYDHCYNPEWDAREKHHALAAKNILGYNDAQFFGFKDERLYESLQEIIIAIEQYVNAYQPNIVYIPFQGDNNQDHRSVFDAARVAFRPSATPFVKRLLMYEIPSSTEQSPPLLNSFFMPNCHVDIADELDMKLAAIRCYESEARTYPHPRSEEGLKILSQKRGMEVGIACAEAFMIIRDRWM